MRHAVFGRRLGRDTNSRKALLNNLSSALILNGSIVTTLAKTKFVKPYVEKMVTSAKVERLGSRRVLASNLPKAAFKKITEEIAPGFKNRDGGYTRIIKLAVRKGDSAAMAKIEFLKWDTSKSLSSKQKRGKVKSKAKTTTKKETAKIIQNKVKNTATNKKVKNENN